MIIREESHVAIDNVIVLALKNADHFEKQAERLNPELAGLFRALAQRRRTEAEHLGEFLRRNGDLPGEPDRDRESMEEIISRLRTLMASDEEVELLTERENAEQELADAVHFALSQEIGGETRDILQAFGGHIEKTRTKLQYLIESKGE